MIHRLILISLCMLATANHVLCAQGSIVGMLRNNLQLGKQYYEKGHYAKALEHFEMVSASKIDSETQLKIARSLFFVRRYSDAANVYTKIKGNTALGMPDLLYYADLNNSIGNYPRALECYEEVLRQKSDDPVIMQKIWQLRNRDVFFEDSLHYTIRRLPLNTPYTDLCAVPFRNGIVFLSNRKEIDFRNPDNEGSDDALGLYYAEMLQDTAGPGLNTRFRSPVNMRRTMSRIPASGPLSFYADDSKCVLTGFSNEVAVDGSNKKQLFFSALKNGKWSAPTEFEHNNKEYNFTDPSISPDGLTLFFASDRPGGFGQSDIYRCRWVEERWSTPENLGEQINTPGNECSPFIYHNTLYFSSDGHPGLGALDIFSTILSGRSDYEIRNLGYPINSGADDFGFVLRTGSQGYFTSNRKSQGNDDDVYEFEMDFRTYPFEVSGVIRMSDPVDTLDHRPMGGAVIELVDYARGMVIGRTQADARGGFTVTIPWFSKFALRLFEGDEQPYIVSLEINRESSENSNYEIVVVKRISNEVHKKHSEGN